MDPIYEIELQDCPYCRGTGTVEDEQGWCVYVTCVDCGAQTAPMFIKAKLRFYKVRTSLMSSV